MLILSNITSDSFNVSWAAQAGFFAKIVINVSHAHSLHESQLFTVPGDTEQAHITGLVEDTGYDVSVAGTTWAGNPTRPLTAFVITGTQRFMLVCLES
jgi:syndecan 4